MLNENTKDLSEKLINYVNWLLDTAPVYQELENGHEDYIKEMIELAYEKGKLDGRMCNEKE